MSLLERVLSGERRAIARAITELEDSRPESLQLLRQLFPHTGHAIILGITGSPGAGKSTLVDALATTLLSQGKRVGILAVDPSSPFSGGAILGDRIRMHNSAASESVFIRSLASRGAHGGLAPNIDRAIQVLDAAKFDFIIVETVGVGQAEVEIIECAHCVVVVLVPGMGDSVQALKAGIVEIADVFVINKADHAGANKLEKELLQVLQLAPPGFRKPEIKQTIAHKSEGIPALWEAIEKQLAQLKAEGEFKVRSSSLLKRAFERELERAAAQAAKDAGGLPRVNMLLEQVFSRKIDPSTAARMLLDADDSSGKCP